MQWTSDEDKILKELYETAPREDIQSKLPNRPWKSIYKRATLRLNLYCPREDSWSKKDDELLKKLYPQASKEDLLKAFPGRTWKSITWRAANKFRIFRDEEAVQKEAIKTNLSKRGVEYPTQSAEVRNKVKKTVREKYKVDNVFQSEGIKEKLKQTNLEKYGVENPNQSPEIREKSRQTVQMKYGVDNPFQMVDRVQKGMLKKYGVKSPLQDPDIKKKAQETNVERYGFVTPCQNDQVKARLKLILQSEEIHEKRAKGYKDGGQSSIEEIEFLKYLRAIDPETTHHKIHPVIKHVIDYYMPAHDLWVQYDGVYWHGKIKSDVSSRHALNIRKIIERDEFQNKAIPNLIRFWSDEVIDAVKDGTILDLINSKIKSVPNSESSHQYRKKLQNYEEDIKNLPFNFEALVASQFDLEKEDFSDEISDFIKKYEWLGTIGVAPKWCFTARYKGYLAGVVLINEPVAYSKILGPDTPRYEALIQRGASASWTPKNLGSRLIMFSCKWMVSNTDKRAFVGYADFSAKEKGIIYQACGFDYLGDSYGESYMYRHPEIKKNPFSKHSLSRTSAFKSWCRKNNIELKKNWFKENGFKNLKEIPKDIKKAWYDSIKKILAKSEKIKMVKRRKYVLVLGKTRREKRDFHNFKTYIPQPYIKNISDTILPSVIKHGKTKDRKNPAKIQFLIDNYGKMSRPQLAKELNETEKWVKRNLRILFDSNKLTRTRKLKTQDEILTEDKWPQEVKSRAIELQQEYLKTREEIIEILDKEYGFKIRKPALHFWLNRWGYKFPTKQQWLKKFLPLKKIQELRNKKYRYKDISDYLKDKYGVYISEDLVSIHIRELTDPLNLSGKATS